MNNKVNKSEAMMHNILVTGGAGFIGSNFIHFLLRVEPNAFVFNLDALTYAANIENMYKLPALDRYRFIEGDINDRGLVGRILREHEICTIIHFAAETHVDRSIYGPDKFVQTNIVGTFNMLEAARQAWLTYRTVPIRQAHFHHVSTDEVYGSLDPSDMAFAETTPYAPHSPYAASKASSDYLVRAYSHTYGLPATITNCSNNYGPYQFPEKLVPLIITNALNGRSLPIYGDGMQVRDWIFVEDHCEAIWQVVQRGRLGETYNVGGNSQVPNIQIVKEICSVLDDLAPNSGYAPHFKLCRFVADRPGHDRRYAINTKKIGSELGWRPKEDLRSGLLRTVQWYLNNSSWVNGIMDRPEYQAWLRLNYKGREKTR
jgi:dTDP-glucose 4,6-dehydratase